MVDSVCIFGDSVARGVVLDDATEKYILLKENFVNRVKESAHIQVKNYSRFGCTVTKGADMVAKHLGELKNYDYVLLEYGGNDCDFDWAKVSENPDGSFLPHTPLGVFVQKYIQIIRSVKGAGSQPILLSLPPLNGERYFSWISRGLNAKNILHWLGGDKEYIYRWHEMYNEAVYRIAAETHTSLIDITMQFLESKNYKDFICKDGIHPSALGHAQIARVIRAVILQYRCACAS
jgi:lysophospholipase L1-like esterase